MEPKVIVITGPTCSGKTYLSLQIAERLDTEIISADSRQVFKLLTIGTAKPGIEELYRVKHYFINTLLPDEDFNVSRFESEALKIIEALHKRGKIPIVVGGSGLYIKAVVDGIFNTAETDTEYREYLRHIIEAGGTNGLYNELMKVDPSSALRMLPQNYKRVMRALEVYHLTGKSITEHHKNYKRGDNISFIQTGLNRERTLLYENIEIRVDRMLEEGLVNEVKSLLAMGYSKELNALNTVGYKEIISYLNGETDLHRAIELIKRNTRRFAKRQMTWFRADNRIKWFDVASEQDLTLVANVIVDLIE
ncbi:MAG: tRNA (adenosine(37)-N6)-dimethylallyltransferase MiaA [Ignavibacteria bacterium]